MSVNTQAKTCQKQLSRSLHTELPATMDNKLPPKVSMTSSHARGLTLRRDIVRTDWEARVSETETETREKRSREIEPSPRSFLPSFLFVRSFVPA